MTTTDTTTDELQVRKIINTLYLADVAFGLEDEQLGNKLVYDSLYQLADYYSQYENYAEI